MVKASQQLKHTPISGTRASLNNGIYQSATQGSTTYQSSTAAGSSIVPAFLTSIRQRNMLESAASQKNSKNSHYQHDSLVGG